MKYWSNLLTYVHADEWNFAGFNVETRNTASTTLPQIFSKTKYQNVEIYFCLKLDSGNDIKFFKDFWRNVLRHVLFTEVALSKTAFSSRGNRHFWRFALLVCVYLPLMRRLRGPQKRPFRDRSEVPKWNWCTKRFEKVPKGSPRVVTPCRGGTHVSPCGGWAGLKLI